MTVHVMGYRHLIEPPVAGGCEDDDCQTVAARNLRAANAPELAESIRGADVLLVAQYRDAPGALWTRVCAPCDERRLRAWIAEDSTGG
jgi:hypothetical protein